MSELLMSATCAYSNSKTECNLCVVAMLFWQEQQKTPCGDQFNLIASRQLEVEVFDDAEQKLPLLETGSGEQQTKRWLLWLASQLKQDNSTQFLIESLQPSWLKSPQQKRLYQVLIGIIAGLVIGLIYSMSTGWIGAVFGGASYGLVLGRTPEIYPIRRLKVSLEYTRVKLLSSILEGLWWGIIYGLIDALICGFLWGLEASIWAMLQVVIWGLVEGIIWGTCVPELEKTTVNNQGMKESAKNAVFFTFIGGGAWLLLYIAVLKLMGESLELQSLLVDSISCGLFFGIYVGGFACLQHFVLRFLLWRSGDIPWNYAQFLKYATERGFLEPEAGGYRFKHSYLLQTSQSTYEQC